MIGRKDFTAPEWQQLQTAIIGTIKYMSLVLPHYYGDIKETIVAKQAIKAYIEDSNSSFLEELSDFEGYASPIPDYADDRAGSIEAPVLQAITNAVAIVKKRDAHATTLFKNLILKLAYKTAQARIKISPEEYDAFTKIALALEATPPKDDDWNPSDPLAKLAS